MMGWLFTLVAAAAGVTQAGLLAFGSRRVAGPVPVVARPLVVGVVLLLAALAGHLASAAVGWMVGFAATCVLSYRRLS